MGYNRDSFVNRECPVFLTQLHGLHSTGSHIGDPVDKRLGLGLRHQHLQLYLRVTESETLGGKSMNLCFNNLSR